MDVNDFAKSFTSITYCDLVPPSFTVLRAESEWTRKNGGGCANHKSWKLNPQLLMKVTQKSHITISLNQPDSRMQFRTGEKTKADFDELYGYGSGYEEHIGFTVFKGSERKVAYSTRDKVADASYSSVRTVSCCIPECAPGEYIIVPTTFDPCMMKFRSSLRPPLLPSSCDPPPPPSPPIPAPVYCLPVSPTLSSGTHALSPLAAP